MRAVPNSRLLFASGLLVPLSLFVAIDSSLWWIPLGAGIIVAVLTLFDFALSNRMLDALSVEPEPVSRFARGAPGTLKVHFSLAEAKLLTLTAGLPLPGEFSPADEIKRFELEGSMSNRRWTVSWETTPHLRGVYSFPPVHVEASSRLGFLLLRRAFHRSAEIRVYPNLRHERHQLANLFLNRSSIGVHSQRMIGQGREYEQLREYNSGDSMLDVHWKASAKRGQLVTKTYRVERTQEIYLIVDHSRLSGRLIRRESGVDNECVETALERYLTAASVLSMVAGREGDLFGFVSFARRVTRFVRAGAGRSHNQAIQDAFFDLESESGPFDLDELFTFLRMRLRRRGLIFILSDLADAAAGEEFLRHVGMISSQHIVMVNSIRRPGVRPIYSPVSQSGPGSSMSEELAGHFQWSELRKLELSLRSKGVKLSLIDEEKLTVELVNQYLSVKQRQLI